ncbi:MAG TPA: glycoside hydrolase family 3 protein [Thioploca sp.]|nr:glycoside hydrolase family 3 protein [Thioploca sp.]
MNSFVAGEPGTSSSCKVRLALLAKKHCVVVFLILLISLPVACDVSDTSNTVTQVKSYPIIRNRTPQPKPVSLDEKIGQMLMVGFRGTSIRDQGVKDIIRDIKKFQLGGVILFDYDVALKSSKRNIKSPKQVTALIEELQVVSSIPLLIAIEQEGGKRQRLKKKFGFPATASARYLGKKNDLALTYRHASVIAKTLARLGINFNFAPVVDLNLNRKNPAIGRLRRSFSASPYIVTRHALKFIEAHHEQGIFCALKYFPGQGSATDDSRFGLVDVTDTWQERELEPYKRLIGKGMADAIMTAHVFNGVLDYEYPATLSKRSITGVLRQQLGYTGVVVSDDMQMKAITRHYPRKLAIQKTLEAGIDIIVIGNNLKYEKNIVGRTVAVIKQLIRERKLSQKRIDESYSRILALKNRLPKKYRFTVNATPSNSRIRIMNIDPKYFAGIKLEPGRYDILVEKYGYLPNRQWITIEDKDVTVAVELK